MRGIMMLQLTNVDETSVDISTMQIAAITVTKEKVTSILTTTGVEYHVKESREEIKKRTSTVQALIFV